MTLIGRLRRGAGSIVRGVAAPGPAPEKPAPRVPRPSWTTFSGQADFDRWSRDTAADADFRAHVERAVLDAWQALGSPDGYRLPGVCTVCDDWATFEISRTGGTVYPEVGIVPNWREVQICRRCGLSARMRAAFDAVESHLRTRQERLWIAEQLTPLYRALADRLPGTIGSEFLGDDVRSGDVDDRGLRHEDCCRTSFRSGSLDLVASFDVLEHVPDYAAAWREARRVLRKGGVLVWSAPFRADLYDTVVRATVDDDGEIRHLLPPEYHGDPLQLEDGILCYQHFGWDVLDGLHEAGFREAQVWQTWSLEHGLLGIPQRVVVARA